MGLLYDEMDLKLTNSYHVKHFRELGYDCKKHDTIRIKISDLPKGSNIKIKVICDVCGKEKETPYTSYLRSVNNGGYYSCSTACSQEKMKNTCLDRYGVENAFQSEEIKDRIKKHWAEEYGVENPAQTGFIKDKIKKTCMDKYGCSSALKNKEVRQKISDTCMNRYGYASTILVPKITEKRKATIRDKYGVEYPLESQSVRNKFKTTVLNKYGVDNVSQNQSIKNKKVETMTKNGTTPTSRQQQYLYDLFKYSFDNDVEINKKVSYYVPDITFNDDKIIVEYDGGAHNLGVQLGFSTEEKENKNRIVREQILKKHGYKIITIVSNNDKIPSGTKLLEMYLIAKDYLTKTNHTWYEFNISSLSFRNADNKEGSYYDYGELRGTYNKLTFQPNETLKSFVESYVSTNPTSIAS